MFPDNLGLLPSFDPCIHAFERELSLHTTYAATFDTVLAPSPNPEAAKVGENLLVRSLKTIESVWLKGDAKFLNGNPQPSIADLSLVCEIMQLEVQV